MAHDGGGEYKKYPWWKKVVLVWTHDGSESFAKWIWGWKFEPLVIMPVVFVVLLLWASMVDGAAVEGVFIMVVALSPFWLPLYLGNFFWVSWIHYIRYQFWFAQHHVLLEVTLPPEVEKSPAAMELFLTTMFNSGGEGTFLHRAWKGQFRPIWTLEIASNEGRINFYIHLRRGMKDVIEARLYGQFPEAQVRVVDDYVAKVPFDLANYELFGAEFFKVGKVGLPIMTYINYGLDKNPDTPEIQVDPITSITEFLGTIGAGEHIWFQIIMRARKKDEWYGFYREYDSWGKGVDESIQAITKEAIGRAQELTDEDAEKKKVGSRGAMLLSPGEREKIEALERQKNKNVFECGVRVLYIARKENFNGVNNGHTANFFQAFRQQEYNYFVPTRGTAYFDYPWQDFHNIRKSKEKHNMFFRYKERAYFFVPYDQVPVFMSTEEIATLWHFPSSVVKTPALNRVPARVSEAPINLPTGSK